MFTSRFLDIPPLAAIGGTVRVPGSKSISNRALLLAGFAEGTTTISGLLHSDDTQVMLEALTLLGCRIEGDSEQLAVTGIGARPLDQQTTLWLGNAGTAMRPLVAAIAIAAAPGARFEFRGTPRMHERPIGDLVDALRSLGCAIDYLGVAGFPPLLVRMPAPLALDRPIIVRGDVSSQFLTSLLLALPLRAGAAGAVVEVAGELISKPYVAITLRLLERFGVAVERDGWRRFRLAAAQALRSPGRFLVEGDASSASYFIAAGAIAASGPGLRIEGVGDESIQGDIAFVDAARAMGATIETEETSLVVRRGRLPLAPITLDCNHMPDAAMTLAALALFADGTTRLTNIASWRVKETDRLAAMASELRKLGATVEEGADSIAITPARNWHAAAIDTYDDHRMAMAMSLAAFNGVPTTAGAHQPIRILDPRCVAKTWPGYFETLFGVARAEPAAIPVLTIDGPSASGKGTLASAVADALGYILLDSGAVYRATAIAALQAGVAADDEPALAALARAMDLRFAGHRTFLDGADVSDSLRLEEVGALASRISAWPSVRTAVLGLQTAFRRLPGLVADGRDMGTVVFPDATLKVFLTASAAERAERRYKQLISKGISANIDGLRADLEARDVRDTQRSVSPLKPAEGALLLDNSALSIEASVAAVLEAWEERRPFDRPQVEEP
jgi:3-phosphoshikimate 1-carboxyvinyltransferase